jgi:glycosyltransferase involved in cell wall biosynthesis
MVFLKASRFRNELSREVKTRFDLVHFNHEALFLLATWLRPRTTVPFTMHIRTMLWNTYFARWQYSSIARNIDGLVFITENERENFRRLTGKASGEVIYNVAVASDETPTPYPEIVQNDRFKIASISNYSWYRATDRLVDVAQALASLGRKDVLFVVAGDMSLPRSLPGELGRIARRGGTLVDYVRHLGLEEYFLFLGHVREPERVLIGCHLLAKLSRESNPWGRDVLEALALGRPVLATGTYDTFVTQGVTGFLQEEFDPQALARLIVRLADNPSLLEDISNSSRNRVRELCNGPDRAADLLRLWLTVRRN